MDLALRGKILVVVDLAPDGIALDGRLQAVDLMLLGAEHLLLPRQPHFLVRNE